MGYESYVEVSLAFTATTEEGLIALRNSELLGRLLPPGLVLAVGTPVELQSERQGKFYGFNEEVEALVTLEGVTFTLLEATRSGEDEGDKEQYRLHEGTLEHRTVTLLWSSWRPA